MFALGVVLVELLTGRLLDVDEDEAAFETAREMQLETLTAKGLSGSELADVRSLLEEMTRFDPDRRPTPQEVERTISAMGLRIDLQDFARNHVVPLMVMRPSTVPSQHPDFDQVKDLSDHGTRLGGKLPSELTTDTGPVGRRRRTSVDRQLRAFLSDPRWPRHRDSLQELLDTDAWSERPFLEVLERGHRAWWQVWIRPPKPDELVAAMDILGERPTLPESLRSHLLALKRHDNGVVRQRARDLLGRLASAVAR